MHEVSSFLEEFPLNILAWVASVGISIWPEGKVMDHGHEGKSMDCGHNLLLI